MNIIRHLIIVGFVALILVSCAGEGREGTNKIGLALPLTGPLGFLGKGMEEGFQLYLEEHPEFKKRVIIREEDITTSEISRGVAAAKKLIHSDSVDVMLIGNSSVFEAIKRDVETRRVVTFGVIGSDVTKGMNWGFKFWMSASAEMKPIADEMRTRGAKKVTVITSEQVAFLTREKALLEEISKNRAPDLELRTEHMDSVTEAQALATKIMQNPPELIVSLLINGQAGVMAKELQKLGFSGTTIGTVVLMDTAEIRLADGALSQALYSDTPVNREFINAYQKRHTRYPTLGVTSGYDIAKIIHEGLDRIGSLDKREAFNKFVRVTPFKGSLGEYAFENGEYNSFSFRPLLQKVEQ